ncbi:phage tail terminator-like protein [Devosia chinhatensis]|uniref:Uncharacterized protein n=1 Tax=Devosia chinhatensis TaxID=429727 RepID=A0A0F5FKM6_9HYPH|nr:phage tail terminator-like protein [Devosia chinhatensis]KKB09406.1 hypothetical protein VE26_05575 [Devosia chinhatensis]
MSVPSIETKIAEAIKARVATLPMVEQYTIVWTDGPLPAGQNTYTPSPAQRYLRCTWTPNQTQRQFIGSKDPHRRPSMLQIDVMGLKTQASPVAREVAGQVALHFPADLRMAFQGIETRVTKAPSALAPFIDTHIQVPVVIELEAYA